MSDIEIPTPNSIWRHANGNKYIVVLIANLESELLAPIEN